MLHLHTGEASDNWSSEVRNCLLKGKLVTAIIRSMDEGTTVLHHFVCEDREICSSWYIYTKDLQTLCSALNEKQAKFKPLDKRIRRWVLANRPKKKFLMRPPALRMLEGWQTLPDGKKIKISCRWNDMLRAVDSKHFTSCFKPEGVYAAEVFKRLTDMNNYAVAILQDKAGGVLGRSFFTYEHDRYAVPVLQFDPAIGNGDLKNEHLLQLFPEQRKAGIFTVKVLESNRYYTR